MGNRHASAGIGLVTLALLVTSQQASADVRLPKLISEGMVLQQKVDVPLWGWAEAGEQVTVAFQGQTVAAAAAADGRWKLKLAPLKAGGPFVMTIAGKNTIELKIVFVGEVWVSCGQSNMMMGLGSVDGGPEALAEASKYPQVRVFNVTGNGRAEAPAEDISGQWGDVSGGFSAVSYFFGRALNKQLQVPIGLINVVEIVPAEAWVDAETLAADPFLAELKNSPLGLTSKCYNGLIAPLQPYAIEGAIYYQGEYNVGGGRQYRRLMPALISSWRKTWGQGNFPFLITQLTAFSEHKAEQDKKLDMPAAAVASLHQSGEESAWAELREAQAMTAKTVPKVGMAVTIDLGDPQDIHPKRKQPIGERLALVAREIAYGEKLMSSGPELASVMPCQEVVTLKFRHADGGLVAPKEGLEGFELGRPDGTYVFAKAVIDGSLVHVSHPDVEQPVSVRYGWANYPHANLSNKEGLPAAPFRAFILDRAVASDSFTIEWRNGDFETPGAKPQAAEGWSFDKGATRSDAKASSGKWSLRLPPDALAAEDDLVRPSQTRYDWNSDPLSRCNFRPGYVTGYSLDVASGSDQPVTAYLRLCGNSTAMANEYWGGIPQVVASSEKLETRHVAAVMQPVFQLDGRGVGVGALLAYLPPEKKGELFVDHLSPITVLRPLVEFSDWKPIDLSPLPMKKVATSSPRTISNSQTRTLPFQRTSSDAVGQVATVLYGVSNLKSAKHAGSEHLWDQTDHVGATIVGKDAALFEFVSANIGATPQQLKLVGADSQSGLRGGPDPESEELVVKFIGSVNSGSYAATLRIVTQASNIGTFSTGGANEPPENFHYVDIPITARVMDYTIRRPTKP